MYSILIQDKKNNGHFSFPFSVLDWSFLSTLDWFFDIVLVAKAT